MQQYTPMEICSVEIVYIYVSMIYKCTEGLAWDWVNEKLYWTDACEDEIEVYDPVTQHRRQLISTGSNPVAIIVDPVTGYELGLLYKKMCIPKLIFAVDMQ